MRQLENLGTQINSYMTVTKRRIIRGKKTLELSYFKFYNAIKRCWVASLYRNPRDEGNREAPDRITTKVYFSMGYLARLDYIAE